MTGCCGAKADFTRGVGSPMAGYQEGVLGAAELIAYAAPSGDQPSMVAPSTHPLPLTPAWETTYRKLSAGESFATGTSIGRY